jgi:hypothetical protein
VVGCYTDEKRAVKLVLAMLIQAPERWNRGSFSWLNRQQLELLRRTLGVEPLADEKTQVKPEKRSELA